MIHSIVASHAASWQTCYTGACSPLAMARILLGSNSCVLPLSTFVPTMYRASVTSFIAHDDDPNCTANHPHAVAVQQIGFVMVSILYFVMAGKFLWLSLPSHVGLFQFLYFFSAFWSQFGPNCTTFLLAGVTVSPQPYCQVAVESGTLTLTQP